MQGKKTSVCVRLCVFSWFVLLQRKLVYLLDRQCLRLQLQVHYKEEFEKNKGKAYSQVADTPEFLRLKKSQEQISNVSPHTAFKRAQRRLSLLGSGIFTVFMWWQS